MKQAFTIPPIVVISLTVSLLAQPFEPCDKTVRDRYVCKPCTTGNDCVETFQRHWLGQYCDGNPDYDYNVKSCGTAATASVDVYNYTNGYCLEAVPACCVEYAGTGSFVQTITVTWYPNFVFC